MRRAPNVELGPVLVAVLEPGGDDVTEAILDAAAAVLEAGGLRRCTVEEIAAQGRLGRSTIYRRFDGRDDILHAVLGREARRVLAASSAAVQHLDRYEDRVVEGLLAGLKAAESSMLARLVRAEPDLLLLVTTRAQPLVEAATAVLAEEYRRWTGHSPSEHGWFVAESMVRLAVSLVLAPSPRVPLDDHGAAAAALHRLLDPLLDPDHRRHDRATGS